MTTVLTSASQDVIKGPVPPRKEMQQSFLLSLAAVPCMDGRMHYPRAVVASLDAGSIFSKTCQPFAGRAWHTAATHNGTTHLNSNGFRLGQPLAELTKVS
jgi:hypothetical protein